MEAGKLVLKMEPGRTGAFECNLTSPDGTTTLLYSKKSTGRHVDSQDARKIAEAVATALASV